MKKNLIRVLSLCLMATMILSGCNKNGDETQTPTTEVVESTAVSIVGTGTHEVGEVVTLENLITVEEAQVGNITQQAILGSDGSLITELDTSTPGSYQVNIIVEFIDGSGYNGTYAYEVTGPTADEEALQLYDSASKYDVISLDNGSVLTFLYDDYVFYMKNEYSAEEDGSLSVHSETTDKDNANSISFMKDSITYSINTGANVEFSYATYDNLMQSYDLLFGMIGGMVDGMTEENGEDDAAEEFTNALSITGQFIKEMITDGGTEYAGVLYSLDGTQYSVERAMVNLMYSKITGQVSDDIKITAGYKITNKETGDVFCISNGNDPATLVSEIIPESETEETEESPYETLEDMMSYIRENANTDSMVKEDTFSIDELKSVILAGQVIEEATEPEQEVEDTEVDVNISEEIQEVPNDTIAQSATYQERHPEIYTWPESETKYRRFLYAITPTTTFNQSIYFKDGTYRLSGEEDVSGDVTMNGENVTGGTGGTSNNSKAQTHNIVSPYATYVLTANSNMDFDTANSTTDKLTFTYGNQKYYVESVKSSDISKYQKSSIYNTDYFEDGSFTVEAKSSEKRTTALGQIIPYNVTYKDPNSGRNVTNGYMVVYNIQNDYLCLYSENLQSTITLLGLMEELVTEVK